jgi:hypothetical protein
MAFRICIETVGSQDNAPEQIEVALPRLAVSFY